ncbi:predicted protein [Plenodomus lingam JN3]|uniref:Predicted protein n=1 Tax=Leptosphaeria maculans (strain JN3 / isolate v23.1.3 / race Av1-4-5-6-7-8) TaxID=985895 RepID=E4ZUP9_LEPMJ|nr:predicted protein [Plenodomus lingam JN3]CBX95128.1 predicted protein [Plenodomus lingam JN3]
MDEKNMYISCIMTKNIPTKTSKHPYAQKGFSTSAGQ